MIAAQLQALNRPAADGERRNRFIQARFEALAEWGIPTEDALALAAATDVDIVETVDLLRRGCPSHLVLAILG
jgi:hypothetical protein